MNYFVVLSVISHEDCSAADVATAKGLPINQVLHQIVSKNSRKSRLRPRCYSPTSVLQFNFDFDAVECSSSLV